MSKIILLFIGCALLCFIPAHTAHAIDATVTDCTNFSGPGTISQAIADANSGGGTITFACSGTIVFFTLEFIISADVTLNANGNTVTFFTLPPGRFFTVNTGASLTLDGFTLNNGGFIDGGAIINNGTLTIQNSTFTNNFATDTGGAIVNNSSGITTITNSVFINNSALNGGAIFNNGTVTITNSTFTSNSASNGGAIFNNAILTITNSTFTNNSATSNGGAILNFGVINTSQDSHYENNTCFGSITDNGGNTAISATGCPGTAPIALDVSPIACVGNDAAFSINAGDANFDITGTGPDLPFTTSVAFITLTGPATWTNIRVTERRGDRQFVNLGDITCSVNTPLSASATCIGADLQVNILTGDPNFQITADSGTLLTGLGIGTHTITGPVNETNVNVTELGGDTENFALGNFDCFTSETLTASAVCNGANLEITISNGNAPFSISVTDSIGTMNSGGNPLGVYIFTGPDTFTNIGITEDTGDLEVLNLPDVTCTAPIIIVPPPAPAPILPPDPTALGCELTTNINLFNAPDNTYCRILMKDGAVIGYSGAIPAELIALGVIFAVDVYRLEGGTSLTSFPDYARVCLSGQGRLFYMDSRNAPRVSIELQSENGDGLTCGWIPAPGTLILTN